MSKRTVAKKNQKVLKDFSELKVEGNSQLEN